MIIARVLAVTQNGTQHTLQLHNFNPPAVTMWRQPGGFHHRENWTPGQRAAAQVLIDVPHCPTCTPPPLYGLRLYTVCRACLAKISAELES